MLEWGTIVKNLNWTLILNIVAFVLLVWILKRLLYKPILTWLDRRRELEEKRLRDAAAAQAHAQRLREEREALLAKANRRARAIVAQAEAEAQDILRDARREARAQVQELLVEGEKAAARLREEALADLRRSYAELVVLGASKVLAREVRTGDHERLLAELTERLGPQLLG
ncbi:MAG TPA: ATP synthase F0 subunit B [Candidatus Acetothermia bacterium]|nr:ATP synthase F0 subunit B [Candidatus Acetothermia bacterium]